MEQLEAIDEELFVLAEGNGGTPPIPSLGTVSGVEIRTDQPYNHGLHWLDY